MLNSKTILTLTLIATVQFLAAQNLQDDFTKVRDNYSRQQILSMDVDVYSYATLKSNTPTLMGSGMMRKQEENYYSKFLDNEMINNKNCTVIIDHYDKSVTYFYESIYKGQKKSAQIPNIDSLINENDSSVYMGASNGTKKYSFFSKLKDASIQRTDMCIDEKTNFITEILYYYKPSTEEENYGTAKVLVSYKNITSQVTDKNIFSAGKFVTISKGKPVLSAAYKNYKLSVGEASKKL